MLQLDLYYLDSQWSIHLYNPKGNTAVSKEITCYSASAMLYGIICDIKEVSHGYIFSVSAAPANPLKKS